MKNDVLSGATKIIKEPMESKRQVASVSAALTILSCFHGDECLTLAEIHRRSGIAKTRIMRLAGTLELHGFLWTEQGRRGYRLGPSLFRLGQSLERRYSDISEVLRPWLQNLMRESGDTALYSVSQAGKRLCVASEEPENAVRFSVPAGMVRPLHAGASGKILLAFGAPSLFDLVLSSPVLHPLTEKTPTDAGQLRQDIDTIKRQGFAVSQGEAQPDSFAIAVPVEMDDGTFLGALSIAGPISRFSPNRTDELVDMLRRSAPPIARSLSFCPTLQFNKSENESRTRTPSVPPIPIGNFTS
jgi:DNA-binding IclR family transcriptional regulator